jgi:hypothetical protein
MGYYSRQSACEGINPGAFEKGCAAFMYFKSFTKAAKPCGMSRVIIFDITNLKNWVRANQNFSVSFYDT